MELKQIRHFIAVAELGSIASASRKLHIAQPALSRQMTMLENELKVKLFQRLPRGVSLTKAGEVMLEHARITISSSEAILREVSRTRNQFAGTLKIAVVPNYSWLPIIGGLLHEVRENIPNVHISLEPRLTRLQQSEILAGQLDAGVMACDLTSSVGLTGIPVYRDRYALAVPKSSRVLISGRTTLDQFANEDFVTFPEDAAPFHFRLVSNLFQLAGFKPRIAQMAFDAATIFGLVQAGVGCGLVPASYCNLKPENVTLIPLEMEEAVFNLCFVWNDTNKEPILLKIIEFVRLLLNRQDSPVPR
jgi:DNA-binding transcriptional LysR family regulator